MSENVDEIIGILSSICKVSSKDRPPIHDTPIVYGLEGVEITKILNPYDIYQEQYLPHVKILSGNYQVGWILNDAVNECMICGEPFTLIVTRHHCRSCGCLTCDECCSNKVRIKQLPGRKCRVCDICNAKHVEGEEWDLNDIHEPSWTEEPKEETIVIPPEERKTDMLLSDV